MGSHRVILTSTYCYNMHMKRTKEINNKISTFLILCLEWNLYLGWRTIKQMYSNKVMTWIFIIIIQHYPESKCLSPISAFYMCVCVCACAYVCVQSLQSWLTLCDPEDSSPPVSSILGIFQARILEWLAVHSSRGSSLSRDQTWVSCIFPTAGRFFTCWVIGGALNTLGDPGY